MPSDEALQKLRIDCVFGFWRKKEAILSAWGLSEKIASVYIVDLFLHVEDPDYAGRTTAECDATS
tara:strand:+ start:898 stop:1092 length:195 start_codon:yes stop_codon:yes gene_type:complete